MTPSAHPELRGDYHVHSEFSDDAVSTIEENIAAAVAAGLTELRLIDHVRESTDWVPDFLAAVAAQPVPEGLTVFTGVETKVLNTAGDLDVPPDLSGIDCIVIADHQFPGPDGPWSPEKTRAAIANGLSAAEATGMLVEALNAAMTRHPGSQLAHCFSILPKIGLSENDLSDDVLRSWARTAASTGTLIEVNEKWSCPSPRSLRAAADAGARLVASTDSHVATDVGRYDVIVALLDEARA